LKEIYEEEEDKENGVRQKREIKEGSKVREGTIETKK
jgi:hypothetical protein